MITLRAPKLGPIIGETTDATCRIWIRAQDPDDADDRLNSSRRTVGVLGIVEDTDDPQKPRIGDAWYFRLPREFDRTGTFKLGFDGRLGGSAPTRDGSVSRPAARRGPKPVVRSSRTRPTSCGLER